jgi:branched-chain amino acid transport system substrate-binding protein
MKHRTLIMAGVGMSLALVAAACGSSKSSSSPTSSNSSQPYEVGFDSSLSGPYAANGVGQRNGFMAYIDYVNAHGGENGHQIKVTVLDDAADISTATANETQLIAESHVSITVGWLVSNLCGAAATIATAQKVPILCSAIGSNLLDPVEPYVYSARNSQTSEALPMVTFAKTLLKTATPKVAIMIYGSAASSGLQTALEALVKSNGWQLVANENVPLTETDISAQTAQVIAGKPDIIMGSLYDPLAVSFMRSLQAQNVTAPFLDYDGASLQGSLVPLKDPDYYVISSVTLTGQGSGSGLATYQAATQAAGANPTAPFVNVGYVQGIEVASALKTCGFPCSGSAMQKAMDTLNVNTNGVTTGPIVFTPTDHETLDDFAFYNWDSSTQAVTTAASGLTGGS